MSNLHREDCPGQVNRIGTEHTGRPRHSAGDKPLGGARMIGAKDVMGQFAVVKLKGLVLDCGIRHDADDGGGVAAEEAEEALRAPDGAHGIPDGPAVALPAVHLRDLHEDLGAVEGGDGCLGDGAGDGARD